MTTIDRRQEWVTSLSDVELELTLARTLDETERYIRAASRGPDEIQNQMDLDNLKFMVELLTGEKSRRLTP
jgi:hypothetical protein